MRGRLIYDIKPAIYLAGQNSITLRKFIVTHHTLHSAKGGTLSSGSTRSIADFIPLIILAVIRESESYQTDRYFFIGDADRTRVCSILSLSGSGHYARCFAGFLLSQRNVAARSRLGVLFWHGIVFCRCYVDLREPA